MGGVGKTTYINKLLTNKFEKRYLTTYGISYKPLTFNSNRGLITFNVIDIAGQEIYEDRIAFYTIADAVIVMNDASSNITWQNRQVNRWVNEVKNVNSSMPIVYCTNKVDIPKGNYYIPKCNNHFKISCKSNINLYQPLLYLARNLFNDNGFHFI